MLNNELYEKDLVEASKKFDFSPLNKKRILVTGANGGLGRAIIDLLYYISLNNKIRIELVIASTNNKYLLFNEYLKSISISYNFKNNLDIENIDYIIHCASVSDPVAYETSPNIISETVLGMQNIIDCAISNNSKVIYISSGEVYGSNEKESGFDENDLSCIKVDSTRSCYQISKILCENMLFTYSKKNKIDFAILRLCHIFGPTYKLNDNHISQICIQKGVLNSNIYLNSDGLMVRSHCYVIDAALACLYSLIIDTNNSILNISDPSYTMTVKEFASKCCGKNTSVFTIDKSSSFRKYAILNSNRFVAKGFSFILSDKENKIKRTIRIYKKIRESES